MFVWSYIYNETNIYVCICLRMSSQKKKQRGYSKWPYVTIHIDRDHWEANVTIYARPLQYTNSAPLHSLYNLCLHACRIDWVFSKLNVYNHNVFASSIYMTFWITGSIFFIINQTLRTYLLNLSGHTALTSYEIWTNELRIIRSQNLKYWDNIWVSTHRACECNTSLCQFEFP